MGTYRITGAMEDTGSDVRFEIEATDEGMAEKIAAGRGVLIHSIEAMGESGRTLREEAAEAAQAQEQRQEAARVTSPKPQSANEWLVGVGPVTPEELAQKRAPRGTLVRIKDGAFVQVPIGEATLGDLVEVKNGKAYLRVRQHGFIGGIAVGVAVGLVLVWIGFMVLGLLAIGGALGGAARAVGGG